MNPRLRDTMTKAIKRILVAVREVDSIPATTLAKAGAIARANGARIELFHALNQPLALEAVRGAGRPDSPTEMAERIARRSRERLKHAAASPRLRGLKVSVHVEWDYPPHEAIIRRALDQSCNLVIAHAQPRQFASRVLLANTDWELIRHCPVPLLLIKRGGTYQRPAILAAVDPLHVRAKAAGLDSLIATSAARWAMALRGQAHVFHAYVPAVSMVPFATAPPVFSEVSPELLELEAQRVRRALSQLSATAGVPASRCHVNLGDVPSQLDAMVRRTRAQIVVMGAVSRSALQRFFIGSTAEHVLDRVACDVLIVKPRAFRSRVPRRIARRAGV
jgi:universal stress protein E